MHVVQAPIVLGRGVRLWHGREGVEERYNIEAVSSPRWCHPRHLHPPEGVPSPGPCPSACEDRVIVQNGGRASVTVKSCTSSACISMPVSGAFAIARQAPRASWESQRSKNVHPLRVQRIGRDDGVTASGGSPGSLDEVAVGRYVRISVSFGDPGMSGDDQHG
jgi:hypothetical protein